VARPRHWSSPRDRPRRAPRVALYRRDAYCNLRTRRLSARRRKRGQLRGAWTVWSTRRWRRVATARPSLVPEVKAPRPLTTGARWGAASPAAVRAVADLARPSGRAVARHEFAQLGTRRFGSDRRGVDEAEGEKITGDAQVVVLADVARRAVTCGTATAVSSARLITSTASATTRIVGLSIGLCWIATAGRAPTRCGWGLRTRSMLRCRRRSPMACRRWCRQLGDRDR